MVQKSTIFTLTNLQNRPLAERSLCMQKGPGAIDFRTQNLKGVFLKKWNWSIKPRLGLSTFPKSTKNGPLDFSDFLLLWEKIALDFWCRENDDFEKIDLDFAILG